MNRLGLLVAGFCLACVGCTDRGDPGDPCTDLELFEVGATCEPPSDAPEPIGGEIPDGTYAMTSFVMDPCTVAFEETMRLGKSEDGSYRVEVAINIAGLRASGELVTDGTTMTSTLSCGGPSDPQVMQYSLIESDTGIELWIWNDSGMLRFQRVGD